MSRRRGPPGRETAAAESNERRSWYGYGHLTRTEKSGVGIFLHDATRIFSEVTVFSLPVLLFVMDYPAGGWFDAKATGLLAWTVAILAGTLIRGGWVRPAGTETRGWVSLSPVLLMFRVPYFNAVFGVAIFGGLWVGGLLQGAVSSSAIGPLAGLSVAALVPLLGFLAFPRLSEDVMVRWG
ncbi:hypothetical protein [Halorubrum vacuolatum]|uniref:DUF8215 domain-containing protein n=1 Tax=Halorubrum vacuolatum TaxID=63740 RepID=A0A238UMQ9_HALVU|nr:hypothetical protein [Halorubrum vacuolatum]SNR23284.1 hypothetical protein SAMN06264855_10192 [Halorubrum vacuolatum]